MSHLSCRRFLFLLAWYRLEYHLSTFGTTATSSGSWPIPAWNTSVSSHSAWALAAWHCSARCCICCLTLLEKPRCFSWPATFIAATARVESSLFPFSPLPHLR